MSTEILNMQGEPVGRRRSGGAERGPLAEIFMTQSIVEEYRVGEILVYEATNPGFITTLNAWIMDLMRRGYTIIYGQAAQPIVMQEAMRAA